MRPVILLLIGLLAAGTVGADVNIAFVANIDGNWELFVTASQGGPARRLTHTLYDEKQPSWSSDHRKIVYATSDGAINIIDVASRKSISIANDPLQNPKFSPAYSPDDQRIAFIRFKSKAGDDTDLTVYDLQTKAQSRVLDQDGIQINPAWSPDGAHLVYANSHCSLECGRFIQELWIADPHGGWGRQLLMTNSFCQHPVWSPEGRRIAFSSDKGGHFDIWILALDSWDLAQVTNDDSLDEHPAWSSAGDRLAFVSGRSGKMEIWIKDLVSGALTRLRPFGSKDIECRDVAW